MAIEMNNFFKNLPRKYVGSGALFFSAESEILIVRPTYKDHWEIPGGLADGNESPLETCCREVREELRLELKCPKLLLIDYVHNKDDHGDRFLFVFDGGVLTKSEIAKINLHKEELSEYRFASPDEAAPLLGENLGERILASIEAKKTGQIFYREDRIHV